MFFITYSSISSVFFKLFYIIHSKLFKRSLLRDAILRPLAFARPLVSDRKKARMSLINCDPSYIASGSCRMIIIHSFLKKCERKFPLEK